MLRSVREPVHVCIATMVKRLPLLEAVVESIRNQADTLRVCLNDHARTPSFLKGGNIEAVMGPNLGDAGKFRWAGKVSGYMFTIDDDIIYPPDYVERLISAVEEGERRFAVGVHGAVFKRLPVEDYYRDRHVFHYRGALAMDTPVHVLGTGTLAWHSDTMAVSLGNFPRPNMADVWFALAAQRQRVGLVAIGRRQGWLQDAPGADPADSIWGTRPTASEQTKAINRWQDWQLLPHG